ncbi:MAG: tetratricopeptide repeat protein [Bacteroidales bacterium]|nr:tetratricopeptide repeat protein [Bacteroidales bacterium]
MESEYEDDYTRLVLMHPAEAKGNTKLPQPKGDFKRTIEKMQKAIQLHSIKKKPKKKGNSAKDKEFRKRDEFNPFLHNAWLMMGKAQFLNGDFTGAASTFFYISKHFKWLPDVVTEALLWQARSYCALDWNYEAENILVHIKPKQLTNKDLQSMYDQVQADYLVRSGRFEEALPYLCSAAQSAKGAQKNRINFLLGQVYARQGNNALAYEAFREAGSGSSTLYRTKFNARIKQSEVYTGENIQKEVNSLKSMTRYERNNEFLDQIYYAIGNLYLSRKDSVEAEKNYRLAIEKSTRNGIDKALAQLALGGILFNDGDYVKAQPCYSEAVPLLPDNYPDYKMLKRRSDVLDELATYAGNVHLQDSLLTLSEMTPEEQTAVCQKIVDELIKKEKEAEEAAKREEHLANSAAQGSNVKDKNAPTQYQLNTDKSWYFYNPTTVSAGKTEFQRVWGARKLEDDWRRRDKNTFSFDDFSDSEDTEEGQEIAQNDSISDADKEKLEKENDPHFVEYYLKQIPKTEEEKKVCNDIVQEGLYNMGVILKDKLEDYPASRTEFNELQSRFPDNIYRLDVYYNMYLMAVREGDDAQAEKYRQLILNDFADSNYGIAMKDPNYFENLRKMNQIQEEKYKEAYDAYLNNENEKVHALTAEMESNYPLSKILPKFVFIDALSYVTEKDNEKFKERLTTLLEKWPDTDMTPIASDILKGLKEGRNVQSGETNQRGMLWDIRLSSDTLARDANGQPANFDLDPNKPHMLVLAFPLDSVSENQLLYDVARHNFFSFTVKDFDIEQMNFGRIGMILIKGFANLGELEEYRTIMEQSDRLVLPQQVRPILISVANFELLLKEGRSFEEYFQYRDNQNVIKTEESVVGEDAVLPGGPRDQENQEDIISQEESSENIATEEQSQPTEEEQSEPEESANSEEEIIEENEQTVGESE